MRTNIYVIIVYIVTVKHACVNKINVLRSSKHHCCTKCMYEPYIICNYDFMLPYWSPLRSIININSEPIYHPLTPTTLLLSLVSTLPYALESDFVQNWKSPPKIVHIWSESNHDSFSIPQVLITVLWSSQVAKSNGTIGGPQIKNVPTFSKISVKI